MAERENLTEGALWRYAARMNLVVVDVEADGLIPGEYSMVCFGAVVVEPSLQKTFYGQVWPICESSEHRHEIGARPAGWQSAQDPRAMLSGH